VVHAIDDNLALGNLSQGTASHQGIAGVQQQEIR
jgi:hypothetical protein